MTNVIVKHEHLSALYDWCSFGVTKLTAMKQFDEP